jgi:protein CpxP
MKLTQHRALVLAAVAATFTGLSASAMASSSTSALDSPLLAQHLAQRTSFASEAIQLAQAAQTPQAEPARESARKAAPSAEERAERIQRMKERHAQRMAERQAKLKSELKLSAEQEPAWDAFIASQKSERTARAPRERVDWSKLTTPERLDRMQARMAEREAAMGQRFDAIRSFYASLNPEQQKVFDSQRIGPDRGKKGGHPHQRGPHGKQPAGEAPATAPQQG